MHETITVKKKKISWIQVIILAVLAVVLLWLDREVMVRFLTGRMQKTFTGNEEFFWGAMCFIMTFVILQVVSRLMTGLMQCLTDKDEYVAVRKSSMENQRAGEMYRSANSRIRWIDLINTGIIDLIFSAVMLLYLMRGSSDSGMLWTAIILIIILNAVNPLPKNMKRKAVEELWQPFFSDCDPVFAYDVAEHARLGYQSKIEKDVTMLRQAVYCYYMGDYPEMYRKLDSCGQRIYGVNRITHISLRGLVAISQGNMEEFYTCLGELNSFEKGGRHIPIELQRIEEVKRNWRLRQEMTTGDPGQLIPEVERLVMGEKQKINWMDRTFQLAFLQLRAGNTEQAAKNLQLVKDGAGTMYIQKKAAQMLEEL